MLRKNPWLTIWIKPRQTIRFALKKKVSSYHLVLPALGGIADALYEMGSLGLGSKVHYLFLILISMMIGPIIGLLQVYLGSYLVLLTGRIFKGKGTYRQLVTAFSLSYIPTIWALLLWVPKVYFYGQELFLAYLPSIETNFKLSILYIVIIVLEWIIASWTIVILIATITEVQRLSYLKAVLNVILSFLIVAVPVVILLSV